MTQSLAFFGRRLFPIGLGSLSLDWALRTGFDLTIAAVVQGMLGMS